MIGLSLLALTVPMLAMAAVLVLVFGVVTRIRRRVLEARRAGS